MNDQKATVILCTMRREPHFEWAFESLKNQTYKNFEYIIIDGLYNQRKDEVNKLIKNIIGAAFPVLYLPDKPSRWKGKRPCLCSARNTGIIFANGEYIAFHDDCCRLRSDWLERHMKLYNQKGYIVVGSWKYYKEMDKNGNGVGFHSSVNQNIDGIEYRATILKVPTEIGGEWLYGANFGFPINVAEDINGFDEFLDGEMGQDDIDFGIRARRKGHSIIFDPDCIVEYFKTDHTSMMKDFGIIPVNIKLRDGKDHFSNEFAIQELLDDTSRYWTKGNKIQIKDIKDIVKNKSYNVEHIYKLLEDLIDNNKYDWRDNIPINEKIKKKS